MAGIPMRVYRCTGCKAGFAIFVTRRGKENRGGQGITCPLCGANEDVEEVDPVETIGATLAKKAIAFWKSLPSGD